MLAAVTRSFERFEELPFDKLSRMVTFTTDRWKWLGIALTNQWGRSVNYYPSEALRQTAAAFPADFADMSLTVGLKPGLRLRLDEIYFYNHLAALDGRTIFNSHTLRSKANYQFTRALSLRAILDYNGVLPDEDLVALERDKRVAYDLLAAYLVRPGTAVYVGFADAYENVALAEPLTGPRRIGSPTTSTGRQLFVKASYLFRLSRR